jgi:hypothetical protein
MADINMTPTNMQPQNEEMLLKYMMQQGAHSAADQSIAKKQALLNQLRQTTELPGMIQGGGARTIQAAHPLSAIANVAGQVMGAQQQRGLNDQTANLVGERRQDLANLVENQRMARESALPLEKRQGYVPPQAPGPGGFVPPTDPNAYAGGM